TAGMLASLCGIASAAVKSIGDLVAATMPIISALLVSIGAPASAGVFRPLMTFLSGTVVITICGAVLPLTLACGITAVADSLTEGSRFAELVKLLKKSVKWLLGLISTVYFGMTAVRGMTVAAYDGVSVRTAKYAVDKLVPVVGGMVSGTVDTVMGCALLIKNGVGAIAILILVSVLVRPLVILAAGIFVFRLAAAVSQPAADERTVRLFSNAAETVSLLFACVVSAGCMMAVTMLVFIASGGISAGLW
ncbi:MAG: stage III sporulation protein AE, partial [Clostridia bacterium]|nr:stage III sporulation protein AE [Clostridia bacterium]